MDRKIERNIYMDVYKEKMDAQKERDRRARRKILREGRSRMYKISILILFTVKGRERGRVRQI